MRELKRYGGPAVGVEVIEITAVVLALLLGGLVIPLLLKGTTGFIAQYNQFLIGPMVNCALIYAGVRFRGFFKTAGIIFFPSALALTGGLIFAIGNVYSLYMIPAIWLGNVSIVLLFKWLYAKKMYNYFLTGAVAVVCKAGIIFGGFLILAVAGVIPQSGVLTAMWNVMGIFQVITASAGVVLAYGFIRMVNNRVRRI